MAYQTTNESTTSLLSPRESDDGDDERHREDSRDPEAIEMPRLDPSTRRPERSVSSPPLGKPGSKAVFNKTDIVAMIVSLVSLAAAICVVHPQVPLAWYLGFGRQIIIIGFLLSIMNLCTLTVLPTTFLMLEAKFGPSRLQNYHAIVTQSIVSPRTSWFWRLAMTLVAMLPLCLGAAYKRFLGGSSSVHLSSPSFANRTYGLGYPPLGDFAVMNNSVFGMINCNGGFFALSSKDSLLPKSWELPVAVGYNMLLLQNDAAALLDIQDPAYLGWIRSQLRPNETWQVSASVHATVARQNQELATRMREDHSFFRAQFTKMDSFYLYNDTLSLSISMMVFKNNTACMIGVHNSSRYNAVRLGYPLEGDDVEGFRQSAPVFSLSREACNGTWDITKNEVKLISGYCDHASAASLSQDMVSSYPPFNLDTLPVLVHSLAPFDQDRRHSPWRLPAYATSVASAWWARATFMLAPGHRDALTWPGLSYPPQEESITSRNETLDAHWALFLILAVHPVITALALLATACLYSVPVGKDFGLVSMLAGVDTSTLPLLDGAALSGKLLEPIKVGFRTEFIWPTNVQPRDNREPNFALKYLLNKESSADYQRVRLRRKAIYR